MTRRCSSSSRARWASPMCGASPAVCQWRQNTSPRTTRGPDSRSWPTSFWEKLNPDPLHERGGQLRGKAADCEREFARNAVQGQPESAASSCTCFAGEHAVQFESRHILTIRLLNPLVIIKQTRMALTTSAE